MYCPRSSARAYAPKWPWPIHRGPGSIPRLWPRWSRCRRRESSTCRAIRRRWPGTSATFCARATVSSGCNRWTCSPRRPTSRPSPVCVERNDALKIYLARRLLQALLVLLGVSFVVFFILRLAGDPAVILLPPDATAEDLRRFREAMGFNDPFLVQYSRFLAGALRGDFGQSVRHGESAFHLVAERMPATFELAGAALTIALALAIPTGIVSAVRRNSAIDYVSTVVALLGQ